jgi:hypothetical protein
VNVGADSALGTLGAAFTVLLGALAIIGAIATAVAIIRSKTLEKNLELLRGAAADLTTELARVTTERDECRKQLDEQPGMADVLAEIREVKRGRALPPDQPG